MIASFFDTAVKKPIMFLKTSWFSSFFGISDIFIPWQVNIWRIFEIFLTFHSKNHVRRSVPLITKNQLYHTWHLYLALIWRIHFLTIFFVLWFFCRKLTFFSIFDTHRKYIALSREFYIFDSQRFHEFLWGCAAGI